MYSGENVSRIGSFIMDSTTNMHVQLIHEFFVSLVFMHAHAGVLNGNLVVLCTFLLWASTACSVPTQ